MTETNAANDYTCFSHFAIKVRGAPKTYNPNGEIHITVGTAGVDLEPIMYGKPWISDTSNNNCITRVAGLTAPRYLTC